jgi:ribosomal protein S18 acetylase RimI-like enzyme
VDPTISPLCIDDYDEVLRLWSATEGIQLRTADSQAGIALYLERNPGSSFVARVGGELVGAVLCGHDGRRGYLHHLAVAPAHRRRGIATALLSCALNALEQDGIAKCLAFVLADNHDGLAFWARAGWARREDLAVVSVTLGPDPNA